jgi:hypothetical protein
MLKIIIYNYIAGIERLVIEGSTVSLTTTTTTIITIIIIIIIINIAITLTAAY